MGQPANPGSRGKMAVKTACVCVCVCVCGKKRIKKYSIQTSNAFIVQFKHTRTIII